MTSAEPSDTDTPDDGPILGRRRSVPRRTQFVLVSYDAGDRETHHKLSARVDIDASSVFGFMSPKISAAERIGALQGYLLRALVDDDGISANEAVIPVVPDPSVSDEVETPDGDTPGGAGAVTAERQYVPLSDLADTNTLRASDIRYRLGDQLTWATDDEARQHGRDHGSSLRRFKALMDDDTAIVEQTALEEIVDFVGRAGSDRPTKPSAGPSASRKPKARSGRT